MNKNRLYSKLPKIKDKISSFRQIVEATPGIDIASKNILRIYITDENNNKKLIHETNNIITVYYRAVLLTNAFFGTPINKDNVAVTTLTRNDLLALKNMPKERNVQIQTTNSQINLNTLDDYALRYVAIGCGGIERITDTWLTAKREADFNITDPLNPRLYVPLHFGTRNVDDRSDPAYYITNVNQNTKEQYMLVEKIEPYFEQAYSIPMGLKVEFTIPQSLANYEQQDWTRVDLAPYNNDKKVVVINEFGFYYANIRTILDNPNDVFMFAHVLLDLSLPKYSTIGYAFEYIVLF